MPIKQKHWQREARRNSKQAHPLLPTGAAGGCTVLVFQPLFLEVDHTQKAVTIQCSFSTVGCPEEQPRSLWFRYGTHQPENLCLDGCRSETDKFTVGTSAQNQVSLTVNRVALNDSAIYICGIAFPSSKEPKAKQTGGGTVLVVRGQSRLWSLVLCPAQAFKRIALLKCREDEIRLLTAEPVKRVSCTQANMQFELKNSFDPPGRCKHHRHRVGVMSGAIFFPC